MLVLWDHYVGFDVSYLYKPVNFDLVQLLKRRFQNQ